MRVEARLILDRFEASKNSTVDDLRDQLHIPAHLWVEGSKVEEIVGLAGYELCLTHEAFRRVAVDAGKFDQTLHGERLITSPLDIAQIGCRDRDAVVLGSRLDLAKRQAGTLSSSAQGRAE